MGAGGVVWKSADFGSLCSPPVRALVAARTDRDSTPTKIGSLGIVNFFTATSMALRKRRTKPGHLRGGVVGW